MTQLDRIDAEALAAQLQRLSGLRGFPRSPEILAELLEPFLAAAPTLLDGQRIVDEVLRTCDFCPTPKYFYAIARSIDRNNIKQSCRYCDNTGWRYVRRRGISCVIACECRPAPPPSGDVGGTTGKAAAALEPAAAAAERVIPSPGKPKLILHQFGGGERK